MPQISEQNQTRDFLVQYEPDYLSVFDNGVYYPEQRETDMGETSIHIKLLTELLQILGVFFNHRQDIFLSGNMNLYYEKGNSRRWFAPDLLIAFGVPKVERSSYLLWREEIFPQVVFEIASEKTWRNDVDEKLELYDQLGAEEYYILDPEFAYLSAPLLAFQRQGKRLVSVSVENGKVFSPRLGLEIIKTVNSFRLFNPQTNEFLLTLEESEERRGQAELEIADLKAQIERLKSQK